MNDGGDAVAVMEIFVEAKECKMHLSDPCDSGCNRVCAEKFRGSKTCEDKKCVCIFQCSGEDQTEIHV